ncbi:MAG TPA: 3-deoxy-manno-octulosonate cytidylyltransferase [Puia sp.]|nr:3-deoxy-manno-octulosonate cytidylyltransferase [Puia sp.]
MIIGIIPARFASTRFPGKPLIDIWGKSMIQRVYERSARAKTLNRLIVATDDERIRDHVQGFGGEAVMTRQFHASGTDRCFEALGLLAETYRWVINIQGDEPFIRHEQIDELTEAFDEEAEILTQMIAVSSSEQLFDPGEAKIVLNEKNEALYFSRSPIPFVRNVAEKEWHLHHLFYRQVGMYAYRSDILRKLTSLAVTPLEKAESLEQLRWLQNGFRIKCVLTRYESHCVDVPDDIERILRITGEIDP